MLFELHSKCLLISHVISSATGNSSYRARMSVLLEHLATDCMYNKQRHEYGPTE